MKKFINFLKRHSKKIGLFAGVTGVIALSAVAASAWGPDRPTYTVENPADHITFNSITNNPNVGDERNFVVVKDAANQNSGGWQDDITVQPGKEYLVRIYAHNNAASSLNLTAVNTRVSASVPTTTGKKVPISGFVSADNASPQKVWDDISLNSTENFNVAYVPGSAKIYNNGYAAGGNGQSLPDSIVTASGAQIGYEGPNGRVPGCFQYANYITFKVKPQFAPAPNYSISKEVRVKGTNTWSKNVTAQAGQEVEWRMQFQNTGATQLNNIAVVDKTPAHTTSVAKSVQIYDANRPNGYTFGDEAIQGDLVNLNIGNYGAHSNAWIYFNSKIDSEDKLPCGETSLVNNVYATPSGQPTVTANATVKVKRICNNVPSYSCDALNVADLGSNKYRFSVDVTATGGATVNKYIYNFGDATDELNTDKSVVEHQYTKPGEYNVEARVLFNVGNEQKSDSCTAKVVVPEVPTTPPTTPSTPTTVVSSIPSTGPVELVAGIFGTSATAYGVMSFVESRRTLKKIK